MRAGKRPLVVGELNPRGSDPRLALYHLPRGAAGNRLRRIMGLTDVQYSRLLDKVNLCDGRWDTAAAVVRAEELLGRTGRFILLGRKVASAFTRAALRLGLATDRAWMFWEVDAFALDARHRFVLLPHPSGRCRKWNDPAEADRARRLLREVVPGVPWGDVVDLAKNGS